MLCGSTFCTDTLKVVMTPRVYLPDFVGRDRGAGRHLDAPAASRSRIGSSGYPSLKLPTGVKLVPPTAVSLICTLTGKLRMRPPIMLSFCGLRE